MALYSDCYSVFRVNRKDGEDAPTQFTRALKTLDIEPIHASTPQAKGRVERANRTLQDRLVKEMRLKGIGDMGAANACRRRTIPGARGSSPRNGPRHERAGRLSGWRLEPAPRFPPLFHRRFSTRGIAPVEKPWKTLLGSSGRIARARPEGRSEARKRGHF